MKLVLNRRYAAFLVPLLLLFGGMASTSSCQAQNPITVPVVVNGMNYGNIVITVTPGGTIGGGFSTPGGSLSDMERQLGQQHLNWLVIATQTGGTPGTNSQGGQLGSPFIDPPYGGLWLDR